VRSKDRGGPACRLTERREIVAALRCVDAVTWFDEPDLVATLRELRPDVHAKGTDYTPQSIPEAAVDAELGIEIAICGDAKGHSTTELLARMDGA
jgi:bifunctional ADP-heptose synthase (sugar kinase/adenylyltransferase)